MDQQRKNTALLAIACLLLLVAGYRFWLMAIDARNRAALNSYHSDINRRIVSNVGPQKPDPFKDLALTADQRRKIDDILNASLPKLGQKDAPPKSFQGRPGEPFRGPGKNHVFRVVMPMDKIREVLTPEQRKKLDQFRSGNQRAIMGMPGGAPSDRPIMGTSGGGPGPSGPPMLVIRRGRQDNTP